MLGEPVELRMVLRSLVAGSIPAEEAARRSLGMGLVEERRMRPAEGSHILAVEAAGIHMVLAEPERLAEVLRMERRSRILVAAEVGPVEERPSRVAAGAGRAVDPEVDSPGPAGAAHMLGLRRCQHQTNPGNQTIAEWDILEGGGFDDMLIGMSGISNYLIP